VKASCTGLLPYSPWYILFAASAPPEAVIAALKYGLANTEEIPCPTVVPATASPAGIQAGADATINGAAAAAYPKVDNVGCSFSHNALLLAPAIVFYFKFWLYYLC